MRPRPLPVRVLAALIAIGVGALLVGLSVAPNRLPGDTFQVAPRVSVHGVPAVSPPLDPVWTVGLALASVSTVDIPVAVLPVAAAVAAAFLLVRLRSGRRGLMALAVRAANPRAPPAF